MPITTDVTSQLQIQAEMDANRNQHQLTLNAKNAKLEVLRMAKEIVMENHRSVPAGTAMEAGDITTIAVSLETFLNS
jgi:hypothetical protein